MPKIRAAAMAIALGATTACTHLETRPSAEVESITAGESATKGAQRGLSYALPMVQYDLKITRALEECPTEARPWPKFTAKVEAAQRYVAGERFEVDYQALSSIMKSTTFNITYHDSGTLKSINSTAKDKTGEVLTDVARIGLAVASAGMPGVSAVGAPGGLTAMIGSVKTLEKQPDGFLACTVKAAAALARLTEATETVKSLTRETDELTHQINRSSELAALKLLTEKDRDALIVVARRLLDTEEQLRAARLRLSDAQAMVSATEQRSWPNSTGDTSAHKGMLLPDTMSLQKLRGLLAVVRPGGSAAPASSAVPCGSRGDIRPADDCVAAVSSLKAALVPLAQSAMDTRPGTGIDPEIDAAIRALLQQSGRKRTSGRKHTGIVATSDKKWAKGVFVREPVEARLVICLPAGEPGPGGCGAPQATVLNDKPVVAPQLGRLRLLPFTNRPFEDNSIQLAIRSNGLVETFQYGAESAANRASGSLASISEKVEASLEKMEEERRSDIKYARETQAWVRTEAAAIRADELARLTYQIDEKKKQLELLKAQAALAGAETSIQMEAEQARLDAELKELQSQVAKIKMANELAALTAPKS